MPDHSIWTIAHAGHEIPENAKLPDLNQNPELYSIQANAQHKIDFIKAYIDPDNTEVTLVGHSVGCKIVLDIMKSEVMNFKMGFMLFPMFERMQETPAGKRTWALVYYYPKLVLFFAWLFSLFPKDTLTSTVKLCMDTFGRNWTDPNEPKAKMSDANIEAVVKLLDPKVVKHSFYLADTEFQSIFEADYETITKNKSKLKLYYGGKDPWAPYEYYKDLLVKVPGVNAEFDDSENPYPHAFVLYASKPMAQKVANWIKNSVN